MGTSFCLDEPDRIKKLRTWPWHTNQIMDDSGKIHFEQLNTFLTAATGLPVTALEVSLRQPVGFQSNRLYDIRTGRRHLILKEYLIPEELAQAPEREYHALQLLSPYDIAPQPVFYDSTLGPFVVYEYMEGEMWDRRIPSEADLARLADVWLRVTSLATEGLWKANGTELRFEEIEDRLSSQFQTYAAWVEEDFWPGRKAADLCTQALERLRPVFRELAEHDPCLCFCRADPRFANVIQRPDGRLGLVDWEDSGLRDPARELVDILTHPNQEDLLSLEEWQPFLQRFLAGRASCDRNFMDRILLYHAVFPLFWMAAILRRSLQAIQAGNPSPGKFNGLPANLRLRRYLARIQAWPELDFDDELLELDGLKFLPCSNVN